MSLKDIWLHKGKAYELPDFMFDSAINDAERDYFCSLLRKTIGGERRSTLIRLEHWHKQPNVASTDNASASTASRQGQDREDTDSYSCAFRNLCVGCGKRLYHCYQNGNLVGVVGTNMDLG